VRPKKIAKKKVFSCPRTSENVVKVRSGVSKTEIGSKKVLMSDILQDSQCVGQNRDPSETQ